jgi:hypothetical protein
MIPALRGPAEATVGDLAREDIAILATGTLWRVPWELMMLGPFLSCGLLDGVEVRHLTVPTMVASAVRRRLTPETVLAPDDFPRLPIVSPDLLLSGAALSIVEHGWELAVVFDHDPLRNESSASMITARAVYRALVNSSDASSAPTPSGRSCVGTPGASTKFGRWPWPSTLAGSSKPTERA